jgi:lipoprotein-releasing system permease protein
LNVAWFLAKRLAFNTQNTFSKLIIKLAITATAISVAVMIVAMAAFNGFTKVISEKIFSLSGHVHIINREAARISNAEETPFLRSDDTIANINKSITDINYSQPYLSKSGLIQSSSTIEGVLIKGVNPKYNFEALNNFLMQGRWIQFNDSGYTKEICISQKVANKLKVKNNDDLLLYIVQADQERRTRKVKVVGIFKTGIEEYDNHLIIADLAMVQRLCLIDSNQISGYEVFLNQYQKMDSVAFDIFNSQNFPFERMDTKTIKDINPQIFQWLALQGKTKWMLLSIMVVVAVLNIISCLIVLVLERVRMIGVLKAVGAKLLQIQLMFIINALFICGLGILIGVALGLGICWAQQQYGFITLPEESYFISKAVIDINASQVLLIALSTLLVTFVVLLLPSLVVKVIQPIKAINFK